ncbi:hypothetical protein L2D08_21360 [Domibacillus sp. PGB-M46]|uniref:hypothetical protein n=1 Tax=Domibacillus sp. PGB-M46 TaxID=2910255 RepID=UPI001F59F8C4|nr:hypothetical protein [Domibacillus sp. PGB-M46]MCI2256882.1 hypothetical protein [Domibacillus sp. PGB-M46]
MTMVLIGFAFENKLLQVIATGLVTLLRFHFSPLGMPELEVFLLAWVTCFLVSCSLSVLIKRYLRERKNVVRLTNALANVLDSRDSYTANHSQMYNKTGVIPWSPGGDACFGLAAEL